MSSSDVRMLEELTARVQTLEEAYQALSGRLDRLSEAVHGRDISGEIYPAEANHTADREARAALVRRPPRPA